MSFSRLMTFGFGIVFIIILYFIIYYALKIMYKDVKSGGKRKQASGKKNYGIEVLKSGDNSNIEEGTLYLLRAPITIGRRDGNKVQLTEPYVSGNHAKLIVKNNEVFIEDLNSTNGVFVNDEQIDGSFKLRPNDKIGIGSAIFKVIRSDKK
ncbi:FHA domain-containing protein [Clostridium chauvoei]|uniref:FHA domain-containing protein n=1 Tax=Clostridium chauvoei TaxID=46867 RepID=UPI001C8542B1|nr:FHA domain-containing protein [Clostridium chauvoei]MBX7341722.1 FHA domain-containing protein [Clostridium chauvoei]